MSRINPKLIAKASEACPHLVNTLIKHTEDDHERLFVLAFAATCVASKVADNPATQSCFHSASMSFLNMWVELCKEMADMRIKEHRDKPKPTGGIQNV